LVGAQLPQCVDVEMRPEYALAVVLEAFARAVL